MATALTAPAPGISSPGGSSVLPGTAAALGAPSSTVFNGLATVLDPQFHFPFHGVLAAAGTMPSALASQSLPYVPGIRVLARRDAVVLYFANVAGAADYRAYVVDNNVTFAGTQPRGAVVACAGYRQHGFESAVVNGLHTRELMQNIEIPGFVAAGNYSIVVEAISTPCPFPGMSAHTDAKITGGNFHNADPATYTYTGQLYATFTSFNTVRSAYGNEIINGQGALNSWQNRMTASAGLAVPANSTTIPADPAVIARSAIQVQMPFFDESQNAPVIDTGSNAVEDNFANDLVVDPNTYVSNPDHANSSATADGAPRFDIPGAWSFWGRYIQKPDGQALSATAKGSLGLQVYQRHGRLYTTFGDAGQDVGGAFSFASLKTVPQQLDSTKYVHSMFRINSEATVRRYWTWTLCGGPTREELQDPNTHQYKIRPIFYETSFIGGGSSGLFADNPSVATPPVSAVSASQAVNSSARECLSIAEDGTPEYARSDGSMRSSGLIRAQIHPAGYGKGIIALGNNATDPGDTTKGFRYKVDANGNYVGPILEPFDQVSPLTHFDIFVRPDRVVLFVNGRQGLCIDLSDRPLTMKYGMITYGDLIYHSSIEFQGITANNGSPMQASQLYQVVLNQPIATSRAWDVVGESDMVDIPSQYSTFNPATCFKPDSLQLQ